MEGDEILFGNERVTTGPTEQFQRTEARGRFVAELEYMLGDWPVLNGGTECAWAISEIFDAAREYVVAAGPLPLSDPDIVHQLMEREDIPDSDLLEGFAFLSNFPLLIQMACSGIERAEAAIAADQGSAEQVIAAVCHELRIELSSADADQVVLTIYQVQRYLEAIAKGWSAAQSAA